MYKFQEIKTVHLEITTKCQASCPMCFRNINGGIPNPWLELHEISLDNFKNWLPVEFIKQLKFLYMCGNLGDPIIARDTLEIFEYLRQENPNINLSMNTNGSARSTKWWQSLSNLDVHVIFGIDGMSDTHSLYRIGTNWQNIISNATTFIQSGGKAEWHMLVFEHNQHQIEECKNLAYDIGFQNFRTKHSSRWTNIPFKVLSNCGKTSHLLKPTIESKKIIQNLGILGVSPTVENKTVINCKALNDLSIYIAANGNVTPCCFTELSGYPPNHSFLVDYNDNDLVTPNLNLTTLKDIFDLPYFKIISDSWNQQALRVCKFNCGAFDRLNAQFK